MHAAARSISSGIPGITMNMFPATESIVNMAMATMAGRATIMRIEAARDMGMAKAMAAMVTARID